MKLHRLQIITEIVILELRLFFFVSNASFGFKKSCSFFLVIIQIAKQKQTKNLEAFFVEMRHFTKKKVPHGDGSVMMLNCG